MFNQILKVRKFPAITFSSVFFCSFLSSPSDISMMHVGMLQDVLPFIGALFIFIFFLLLFKMYNLCSLILYSVNSNILLNTSSEFFNFGYLLFNSRILNWLFFKISIYWYSLFDEIEWSYPPLYCYNLFSFNSLNIFIIVALKSILAKYDI